RRDRPRQPAARGGRVVVDGPVGAALEQVGGELARGVERRRRAEGLQQLLGQDQLLAAEGGDQRLRGGEAAGGVLGERPAEDLVVVRGKLVVVGARGRRGLVDDAVDDGGDAV